MARYQSIEASWTTGHINPHAVSCAQCRSVLWEAQGSVSGGTGPGGDVRQPEVAEFDMACRIKKEVLNRVRIVLAYLRGLLRSLHPV